MKQNQVSRQLWSRKGGVSPNRMGLKLIIAVFLALTLLSVPVLFAKEVVSEKLKGQDKKGQIELKTTVIAPKNVQSATEINPVKPEQTEVVPASAATDKGTQIKWQIISSGGNCGTGSITYRLGAQDGCELCGTVGQLAVGSGSSESYGINSGYWQEDLQPYRRGDVNKDGIVDVADVMYLINYLFIDGPAPDPLWVGDANCDGIIDAADVVYLINYLYAEGPPPSC